MLFPASRVLSDTVDRYIALNVRPRDQAAFVSSVFAQIQSDLRGDNPEAKADAIQHLIFLHSIGYDTAWADFSILDVMSIDNFSCKRIAYTAASESWRPESDVVLMATNRIQKDLTSNNNLYKNLVLTNMTQFLSRQLAESIASCVVAQLASSSPAVRQRAVISFYHVCLRFPEALKPGFAALKARIEDDDISVVFAVLTVLCELCRINPRNFVGLIPRLFKMMNACSSPWIMLRILSIMRMLTTVEPRLPKKLIQPLTIVLETTSSVFVMYECVKAIIEIPISNQNLLDAATYRLQSFLHDFDPNLRFLCLSLLIKLMKIQPRLVSKHRDLISMCLDSDNELETMMALDLMSNLVTPKTIDFVVGKMFTHFQESNFASLRNEIIEKVVDMITRNDYELVQDFDWFISVLMDFVEFGGHSSGGLLAQQFIELAYRVPDMRPRIVKEMGVIFDTTNAGSELHLAACHIISEFADDPSQCVELFSKVLQPIISDYDERVQESCIIASFILYLKCQDEEDLAKIESLFDFRLPSFIQSKFNEVQEIASMINELNLTCKIIRSNKSLQGLQLFKESFSKNESIDEPIIIPDEVNEPFTIFNCNDEELDALYPLIRKKGHHHHQSGHRKHRHRSAKEDKIEEKDETGKEQEVTKDEENVKDEVFVERMIRRQQHRQRKKKPEEMPVLGPINRSRSQFLGKNTSLSVQATDFIPNHKTLEIVLEIQNISLTEISSIDFSVVETEFVHKHEMEPLLIPLNSNCSSTHTISITFDEINSPQIIKLIIVPFSGESLEAKMKIYPSYFLIPVDSGLLQVAEKKATLTKSISFKTDVKPRQVLQSIANIIQGTVINPQIKDDDQNSTSSENNKSRLLISKASTNDYILTKIEYKDDGAILEVGSPNEKLTSSLLKECEIKLNSLTSTPAQPS